MLSCKNEGEEFKYPYYNYMLPLEDRVNDLISRMTLEEKVSQMLHEAVSVPHLGIPEYNWWNECLHGVARSGRATVFPQAIGLGATFDDELVFQIASAISDEARAKYNAAQKISNYNRYSGLTFFSPNINIFRDPRWGRGQETYGEDPLLVARMGTSFVRGLQGDHPTYLKTSACAKHFAVHSGPETERHRFNAIASPKDMFETYLPAFKALVESGVESVMCAYNRTNNAVCCGDPFLLVDLLKYRWGFKGFIVSDCWALVDFHTTHGVTVSPEESAALAISNGLNLNCGDMYQYLPLALEKDLITTEQIDNALKPLLATRFKLGMFDPPEKNPYTAINQKVIHCEENQELAYQAAVKSIVLLKNENSALPLDRNSRFIYMVGPGASTNEVLLGNYYGQSPEMVTVLEGVTAKVNPGTTIEYRHGCLLDRPNSTLPKWATREPHNADAIIAVMGISGLLEGEQSEAIASQEKGDRTDIGLPDNQVHYLKELRKGGDKPIIVVLTGGGPMDIKEIEPYADAILFAWYPGEKGGTALADIIFGDVSPSGKLPVTFPESLEHLPPFDDYSMNGRTYRYMEEEPFYPFGYGLSYTQFRYDKLTISNKLPNEDEELKVKVNISNEGSVASEEVVQLYLSYLDPSNSQGQPLQSLLDFKRVYVQTGEQKSIEFIVTPEMRKIVGKDGERFLLAGTYELSVGGVSPGRTGEKLTGQGPQTIQYILE